MQMHSIMLHNFWHPFSRSYGAILPSSLTKVLPLVLGFSPHLPVSVCGTGSFSLDSGFSWQRGVCCFSTCFSIPIVPRYYTGKRICLSSLPTYLDVLFQPHAQHILLRPHISQTTITSTGIITCCPSPTLFSLGLGPDLP